MRPSKRRNGVSVSGASTASRSWQSSSSCCDLHLSSASGASSMLTLTRRRVDVTATPTLLHLGSQAWGGRLPGVYSCRPTCTRRECVVPTSPTLAPFLSQARAAAAGGCACSQGLRGVAGRLGAAREPKAADRGALLCTAGAGRLCGDGAGCGQHRAHLKHELRIAISRPISRRAVCGIRRGRARGRHVGARTSGVRRAALAS